MQDGKIKYSVTTSFKEMVVFVEKLPWNAGQIIKIITNKRFQIYLCLKIKAIQ